MRYEDRERVEIEIVEVKGIFILFFFRSCCFKFCFFFCSCFRFIVFILLFGIFFVVGSWYVGFCMVFKVIYRVMVIS